jgi:hypothetical protein
VTGPAAYMRDLIARAHPDDACETGRPDRFMPTTGG